MSELESFRQELFAYNSELGNCVVHYKNLISNFFMKSNCWDQVKKYSNDYEFIFSSLSKYPYIAKVSPPSRSYFKLWEMIKEFDLLGDHVTTAHVAEGPGGFVECVLDWMQRYQPSGHVNVHGMTLMSPDRVVPQWKLGRNKTKDRFHIHTGVDKTGDLYNIHNIDLFVSSIGENSCHLVTGDGGFDIQGQYNEQETMMYRLVAAEMYTALRLCKQGGSAIIKLFDCFTENTIRLLYLFQLSFEELHFVKPYSSRPANSEKYIVCIGKKTSQPEWLQSFRNAVELNTHVMQIPISTDFLIHLIQFNTHFCYRQIFYICKTISYIDLLYHKKQKEFLDEVLFTQYHLCRDWCKQYDIPYKDFVL